MRVRAIKTKVFREGENLPDFVLRYLAPEEKSVVVLTSKIVALSERRTLPFKNQKEKEKIIKKESSFAVKTGQTWFTIKDGMVMASAGVDESNADGKITLLPRDSYASAKYIREILKKKLKLKKIGVLITDSGFVPMRAGAVGLGLGYAGFRGVKNYVGQKDIFGRVLRMTRTNVADSLAAAAVLEMGEGRERTPLAVITAAPVEFASKTSKISKKEMRIAPPKDLYAPLFNKLN